jgi:hypothetical protein
MNTSLYRLTCPLCREKLAALGPDGELLVYQCAQHGHVVLCSDGRMWVEELPELTPADITTAQARSAHMNK